MQNDIAETYMNFLQDLRVQNSICDGFGELHARPKGIPQGCPFSMMVIALVLRPWVQLMKSQGARPRILADDLLVATHGPDHCRKFQRVYNMTHKHIKDLGARLAPTRSYTFSTSEVARDWLRQCTWPEVGGTIPCINHGRDLGAHFNLSDSSVGATLTERLRKATARVRRIARIPISYEDKAKLIREKALALGLYGIEASHACQQALASLRAAITDAIAPRTTLRAHAVVFEMASNGSDLDPDIQCFLRRATGIRRAFAKDAKCLKQMQTVMKAYQEFNYVGIEGSELAHQEYLPAPPSGHEGYTEWRVPFVAKVPIGVLLHSVHCIGGVLDHDMSLKIKGEVDVNLLTTPIQQLRPFLTKVAQRARATQAGSKPELLQGLQEIDDIVFHKALAGVEQHHRNIVSYVCSGGAASQANKCKYDSTMTMICIHRGQHGQGIVHTIWECPKLEHARSDQQLLKHINHKDLPAALRIGVPPAMHISPYQFFWGQGQALQDIDNNRLGHHAMGREDEPTQAAPGTFGILDHLHRNHPGLNARQQANHLTGHQPGEPNMEPKPCPQTAPDGISIYTDGGVANPEHRWWSLGGFGIWTSNNLDYVSPVQHSQPNDCVSSDDQGTFTWGPVRILTCSSARAEFAALIVGIAADDPVHIGIDNKAVHDKASYIINHIAEEPRKPWNLQIDGDLRQVFVNNAHIKGAHAIRLTKVNGHATQDYINGNDDANLATEETKAGNDRSDEAATKGRQMHYPRLHELMEYCASRQERYTDLLQQIHRRIISVFLADQELSQQAVARQKLEGKCPDKVKVPKTLIYADPNSSIGACRRLGKLNLLPVEHVLQEGHEDTEYVKAVWCYLANLEVARVPEGGTGATWLELLIHFHMQGGELQQDHDASEEPSGWHQDECRRHWVPKGCQASCAELLPRKRAHHVQEPEHECVEAQGHWYHQSSNQGRFSAKA